MRSNHPKLPYFVFIFVVMTAGLSQCKAPSLNLVGFPCRDDAQCSSSLLRCKEQVCVLRQDPAQEPLVDGGPGDTPLRDEPMACAGQPKAGWVRSIGSLNYPTLSESRNLLYIDPTGHLYVAGEFSTLTDFKVTAQGAGTDAFLAKYAPDGTPLWVETFGGKGCDDNVFQVTGTPGGKLLLIGSFCGSIKLDSWALETYENKNAAANPGSAELNDVFIAEVDPSKPKGKRFVWAGGIASASDTTPESNLATVASDQQGNVYIGYSSNTADPKVWRKTAPVASMPNNVPHITVAKLGPTGQHLWSHVWGGPLSKRTLARGIFVESAQDGHVYIVGHFERILSDAKDRTLLTSLNGSTDLYVLKLKQSDGTVVNTVQLGGIQDERLSSVLVEPKSGDMILSGHINGAWTVKLDSGIEQKIAPKWPPDLFFLRMSREGKVRWVKSFDHEKREEFSRGMVWSPDGKLTLIASSDSTTGSGLLSKTLLLRIEPKDGKILASHAFSTANNLGHSIGVDPKGNLYISGHFQGENCLGRPISGVGRLAWEMFLVQFFPFSP